MKDKFGVGLLGGLIIATIGILIIAIGITNPVESMTSTKLVTDITIEDDNYVVVLNGNDHLPVTATVAEFVNIGDRCKIKWEADYTFASKLGTKAFCESGAYKISGENNE